jgi:hypothetical protein
VREYHIAWAAGFFDGEGYIGIHKGDHVLSLSVTQVTPEPLERFVLLFGGHVYRYPRLTKGGRSQWGWFQQGRKAAATLQLMLPYLCNKRREAELGLEFHMSKPRNGNRWHKPVLEETHRREKVRLELIAMHAKPSGA